MKTKIIFLFTFFTTLLNSCMSPAYFQVYKTEPTDKSIFKKNLLVFEDVNCKVSYDFWSENGNVGFQIFNKTDKTIYLNLVESYFILNGIAFDYYKDRTFTKSTNVGSIASSTVSESKSVTGINYFDLLQTNKVNATNSVGVSSTNGYSVTYLEEKVISIPSNTSKIISEYSINNSIYRDCDLLKYPSKKEIKTKSFTKSNSPLVFSNRLAYYVEDTQILIKFVNEFYVTEITNYPESEITEMKSDEFCNQKSDTKKAFFKDVAANKFYVKYTKGGDFWKH
jgi:hypothetical protein